MKESKTTYDTEQRAISGNHVSIQEKGDFPEICTQPHATKQDLISQYIDATLRLEQCEKLRRYDLGRNVKDILYDHQDDLEKKVLDLKKALEGHDDDD